MTKKKLSTNTIAACIIWGALVLMVLMLSIFSVNNPEMLKQETKPAVTAQTKQISTAEKLKNDRLHNVSLTLVNLSVNHNYLASQWINTDTYYTEYSKKNAFGGTEQWGIWFYFKPNSLECRDVKEEFLHYR